ncbi:MAG: vitamin B12-dependent ribonucleotide reductase [Bacillota bacterium]|nr:vitamin B12-dependent ribonucleotide reductase [Bacillota bacterium]
MSAKAKAQAAVRPHTAPPLIERYFTRALAADLERTVYDLFTWERRDVHLLDYKTGETLLDMEDLEFPAHYTQNACDIIASKYFRKAGVPGTGHETSMRQIVHRMVDFWVAALVDEGLIAEGEERRILYDELAYGMLAQLFAPNSPQWFNTGLKRAYGIEGTGNGNYYYDEERGETVLSEDDYTRTQASACFILSIEDKLLGPHSISDSYVTETKLFKGGSGTGTNFSSIRAEGERLSGGGVSSGLMSFLKGLDRNAGAIKSGGTTRRAAKMVCLDIDHPEIERFISWKAKEEDKVAALIKMGYDGSIDGEAYSTVSGQNSNNSLRLSDDFMKKVDLLDIDPDATITLRGRIDDTVNRDVRVADLWNLMNESAWRCADPAPQFSDLFNQWHTCPAGEDGEVGAHHNRLNSTNPCGEYAFLDDTSCNLASINIYGFFNEETGRFDLAGYRHLIGLVQLVLEASIHWGQFPTEDIARKTWRFRTTGLGLANLASLLMVLGLPYDSPAARNLAAALAAVLTGHSYAVSARMAEILGPFDAYELNREHMLRVIRNHARAAGVREDAFEGLSYTPYTIDLDVLEGDGLPGLAAMVQEVWTEAVERGAASGYRNAQVSVMAPTGTISFAMDCGATSIEPFFSHIVYKKLVGGGFMTLANPIIPVALRRLGYGEEEVEAIHEYIGRQDENGMILDGKIEGAPYLREEHLPIFDTANTCGSGRRYIAPRGHVLMVAALQPFVTGAISKTVNLPREATVDDFKNVVMLAWKTGVKGITLYRDGSKSAQPLNVRLEDGAGEEDLENLSYQALLDYARRAKQKLMARTSVAAAAQSPAPPPVADRPVAASTPDVQRRTKLVGIRSGHTHPAQIDDVKIYTTVNRNSEGEISEIYITTDREGTTIMGLLNSLSKTISVMLQYRIPAWNIAKMLRGQKYEPYGFVQRHPYIKYVTSISDLISKIIDIELGDFSRVQVRPENVEEALPPLLNPQAVVDLANTMRARQAEEEELLAEIGDDPYSIGFIHESAREAALHGERVYDGSTCPTCSSTRMVQNGTCKVCLDCGTTTGCS